MKFNYYNINVFVSFLWIILPAVWSKEIGDLCVVETLNTTGECKIIYDCPYAIQLVDVEEKKPPMCGWVGSIRIVCCPVDNIVHKTGVFKSYFGSSRNGVLRSQDVTCRYDGNEPVICCGNVPEAPPPPEPSGCPTLELPQLQRDDLPWKKCLEYQRYIKMCVSSRSNPARYVREDTCDMSQTSDRISGGIPAQKREFPHMALLGCRHFVKNNTIAWVGGGSLLSEKYILTAAHVLYHRDHGLLRYALFGVTNKSESRDGLLYNVVRTIPHKLYDSVKLVNDIALLELDRRVVFSEFVHPACLPMPGVKLSREMMVAGWGQTGSQESDSDILLKTILYERDYETQCKKHLNEPNFRWNGNSMICAAAVEGGNSDTCRGDSGGPLMAYLDTIYCSYVIRGIVSWGPKCGQGAPAVYTKVEYFLPWIIDIVWPKFEHKP